MLFSLTLMSIGAALCCTSGCTLGEAPDSIDNGTSPTTAYATFASAAATTALLTRTSCACPESFFLFRPYFHPGTSIVVFGPKRCHDFDYNMHYSGSCVSGLPSLDVASASTLQSTSARLSRTTAVRQESVLSRRSSWARS